jgi:pantoate--beta-alanine ligase
MRVTSDIGELREWIGEHRKNCQRIGFVPTMGYLHEGHLSLVDLAKVSSDIVVMSIFVNPTQFGPSEDYKTYPRDPDNDLKLAGERGVDIAFSPDVETMYPRGDSLTYVDMDRLPDNLCGASRPGHFRGVMTVVTKLLNIVAPDVAVFGQKDIQQLIVIERMVKELNLPVEIVTGPTVREEDGLAMSSRNQYLAGDEREEATRLYRSLLRGMELIEGGERTTEVILTAMKEILSGKNIEVDYISIVSYRELKAIDVIIEKSIVAVAAFVGRTRLIDNFIVELTDDGPVFSI